MLNSQKQNKKSVLLKYWLLVLNYSIKFNFSKNTNNESVAFYFKEITLNSVYNFFIKVIFHFFVKHDYI